MGFTWHAALPRRRWALTSPFHPYNDLRLREKIVAVYFCCTVLEVTFTWRYQASCPTLLGLSSRCSRTPRPYNKLVSVIYIIARLFWKVAHFYAYFFFFIFVHVFLSFNPPMFLKLFWSAKPRIFRTKKYFIAQSFHIGATYECYVKHYIYATHSMKYHIFLLFLSILLYFIVLCMTDIVYLLVVYVSLSPIFFFFHII